jgi:sugar phosphate isomerase/epimerase
MSFFEAVDKAAALGLKYVEMYPGQRMSKENPTVLMNDSMSAELQEQVRKKLQAASRWSATA